MLTKDEPPTISGSAAPMSVIVVAIGDAAGTRTITSIVALLVVLGVGLVMLAFWLFRLTRPDDELLAPLEVMGERKWRRADPVWQRRRLDEVRPASAQPLQPSAAPPDFDEAFDLGPSASGFDDLHEDAAEPAEPVDASEPAEPADPADPGRPPTSAPPASNGDGAAVKPPRKATSPTPIGMARPALDDFADNELDPDVMAAAIAELDAELGRGANGDHTRAE